MKTFQFSITTVFAIIYGMLVSLPSFANPLVTMSMRNITATSNTIEYDLYIVNNGSTAFRLSAYSYGIHMNNAVLNGGSLTCVFAEESRTEDLSSLSPISKRVDLQPSTYHIRLTSAPRGYDKSVQLLPEVPFKIGHFCLKNTEKWLPNSLPDFKFQVIQTPGFTTTQVVGYIDHSRLLTALTPGLYTVETYIENTPVLNAVSTASQTEDAVSKLFSLQSEQMEIESSVYPNPVQDVLHASVYVHEQGRMQLYISDMNGRILKRILADVVSGVNIIDIDLQDLANGTYGIRAEMLEHVYLNTLISKKE
jgi:hypothetical protein